MSQPRATSIDDLFGGGDAPNQDNIDALQRQMSRIGGSAPPPPPDYLQQRPPAAPTHVSLMPDRGAASRGANEYSQQQQQPRYTTPVGKGPSDGSWTHSLFSFWALIDAFKSYLVLGAVVAILGHPTVRYAICSLIPSGTGFDGQPTLYGWAGLVVAGAVASAAASSVSGSKR